MPKLFARPATSWSPKRARRHLSIGLLLFAAGLLIPLAILVNHTFDQLETEAFYNVKGEADDLMQIIDQRFYQVIQREDVRGFDDYSFLNLAGNLKTNFVQLSPLSSLEESEKPPGVVGYFQLSPEGDFSSPLLPDRIKSMTNVAEYGIDKSGFQERRTIETEILGILQQNRIATSVSSNGKNFGVANIDNFSQKYTPAAANQSPKDQFQVLPQYKSTPKKNPRAAKKENETKSKVSSKRKEQVALPGTSDSRQQAISVETFESEIDPMQFSILPSGHAVFFRKVWKEGRRYTQGLVINLNQFLEKLVYEPYQYSSISTNASITVRFDEVDLARYDPILALPGSSLSPKSQSILVKQGSLSAPFHNLDLFFSVDEITMPHTATYIQGVTSVLIFVIVGGLIVIYRSGRQQIALTEQQRDFVSSVSHELKTPLTSIRMYGEMLKEGWASEEKKQTYYKFISSESERLSRLIANVLQLSRLSQSYEPELTSLPAHEAFTHLLPILKTQATGSRFELIVIKSGEPCNRHIKIDLDNFTQVFVNLVDNAIKFSKDSKPNHVEFGYLIRDNRIEFQVRDFGPGIPQNQLKRIFKLFYRAESEMTRTTKGTGIGLALVRELIQRMQGTIDVSSRPEKTVFSVFFPLN